ncbi:MAG TPA: shikimate dehydrogenase [Methanospirillum sp.]|uniref:shikimate dehydrogenase n=1 Tax=Methanospirillum sp. TaxID=45200 RepID=UPI002B727BC8|nr:shikimate dehydrogenase [Methanospirillum sp.]HWQ64283.1 shikimate dehydrogenase [Methanospirillum sp.]
MEDRRIVLIGYRGTGKSSIGKNIAATLGFGHLDLDALIEETEGRTIPEIFAEGGEDLFRSIESRIIAKLSDKPAVISTGGGAILRSENIKCLRRKSQIILLTSSEEMIAKRIGGTARPSLTGLPLEEEIHTTLAERMPLYRAAADLVYDSTGKTPRQAASEILQIIRPGKHLSDEINARQKLVNWVLTTPIPVAAHKPLQATIPDPSIRLYGILGNPCMHSLSPPIWNRLFQELEIPARYTWFECPDPAKFIPAAEKAGVRGLSVTIPHKERVIPLLDEIRKDATVIGAVNTILLLDGKRYGFNTDWKGIYRPLEGISGEVAVILGAGGAAASAVYASSMRGFTPIILNRTVERAREMGKHFGVETGALSDFTRYHPDLVINTTSVGMKSHTAAANQTPIPVSSLTPDMHVFDLVYTPAETPLLRGALEKGCSIIPGTEMFIHQLIEQFKVLTGVDVPADTVRRWIL